MKQLLTDSRYVKLSLDEGKSPSGNIRVRGEFARAGHATENKRVYPAKIWEKEIGRLGKSMKGRSVFGEADHPASGRTSLGKVSHIVTDLHLEDGILVGEAEILPTDAGKNLAVLLQSGCKVGISSRGFGSTKSGDNGEDIVQEDYQLVTFDFVADPADKDAYPSVVESKDFRFEGFDVNTMLAETDKPKAGKKVNESEGPKVASVEDKASVADAMLAAVASMKNEVSEQIRRELLADPAVAGAKTALEAVVGILRPFVLPEDAESVVRSKENEVARLKREISERDLRIVDLEKENGVLAEKTKQTGYALYLERTLRDDPDAAFIIKTIGDVMQFGSASDLKARIEEIRAEVTARREKVEEENKRKADEIDRMHQLVKEVGDGYEAQIAKRDEVIKGLKEATSTLSARLYAEKKMRMNPSKSARVRPIIEATNPKNKRSIDAIFESQNAPAPKDEDDASALRSRIRRLSRGGVESDIQFEETARKSVTEDVDDSQLSDELSELGLDLRELTQLSR